MFLFHAVSPFSIINEFFNNQRLEAVFFHSGVDNMFLFFPESFSTDGNDVGR